MASAWPSAPQTLAAGGSTAPGTGGGLPAADTGEVTGTGSVTARAACSGLEAGGLVPVAYPIGPDDSKHWRCEI